MEREELVQMTQRGSIRLEVGGYGCGYGASSTSENDSVRDRDRSGSRAREVRRQCCGVRHVRS